MRMVLLLLLSTATLGGNTALAQGNAEAASTDEIIVRGQRLADFRAEMEKARERAYDIFNDLNSDDDFDVHCRDEGRTGTRSTQRVCRPRFESRISSAAAQEYLAMLSWSCPGDAVTGFIDTQKCMFNGVGQRATANAQGVESQALSRREQMNAEILRLARQNLQFGQAILDFYEASQRYEEARSRRQER